ncbi:MAG: GxxExxY protein [Chloroflexi bacterium]|nr:GxxExxY protein [Chloroflexota bacterium]
MSKLLFGELTHEIIGAAMEVHRTLGYGFLEEVYENALAHELNLRGIKFETQKQLPVIYKEIKVGHYIADMIVEEVVVLELKALSKGLAKKHHAQIINYLVATGIKVGLLLNFGKPSSEHKRFVKSQKS